MVQCWCCWVECDGCVVPAPVLYCQCCEPNVLSEIVCGWYCSQLCKNTTCHCFERKACNWHVILMAICKTCEFTWTCPQGLDPKLECYKRLLSTLIKWNNGEINFYANEMNRFIIVLMEYCTLFSSVTELANTPDLRKSTETWFFCSMVPCQCFI